MLNPWTLSEERAFERGYADFIGADRVERIAERIPNRSMEEILEFKEEFERRLACIKTYPTEAIDFTDEFSIQELATKDTDSQRTTSRAIHNQSKKREKWTDEEHKLFLKGLKKYGHGNWKSISRYFITTKTPTQIASHAQKYVIRQTEDKIPKKRKKRASIHDMTLEDDDDLASQQQNHQFPPPPPPPLIPMKQQLPPQQVRVLPPLSAPQQQSSPQPVWVPVPPPPMKVPLPQQVLLRRNPVPPQQYLQQAPTPYVVPMEQSVQIIPPLDVNPNPSSSTSYMSPSSYHMGNPPMTQERSQVFYSPDTFQTHLNPTHHQMGGGFVHFNNGY